MRVTKNSGWEDYTILLAWALYIPYVALCWIVSDQGVGTHQWNLMVADLVNILRTDNAIQVIYAVLIALIKVSILLQLLKIFFPKHHRGPIFYTLWMLIVANILLYTIMVFVTLFECTPRERIWLPMVPGKCINVFAACIAIASVNAVSDIVLFIVPIRIVFKLQLSFKRKLGIGAIFASGLLACVSSVMRLSTSAALLHDQDITWLFLPLNLWLHAEITSGFLASCLPCMPRFVQHVWGKFKKGTQSEYSGNSDITNYRVDVSSAGHSHYGKPSESEEAII